MSGSKAVPFHGILAVGNTKDEAVNRYRLLAQGKGVSAMVDAGRSMAFVTHASNKIAEMFNPVTGELDLEKDDKIIGNLEFEAQAGEVEATHYVCESGCGLHIVYDSEALVKHCPACTTAIASDDDEEDEEEELVDEEESEDEDYEDSEDEDEESESSEDDEEESEEDEEEEEEESEEDEEEESDEEEDESDDEESDEDEEESEEDDEEDEEEDDEEDEDDSGEPLVIAADSKEKAIQIYQENRQGVATAATTVEVEYMVCASADCGAHIISEDASLTECPACASDLKQPEAEVQTEAAPVTTETQPVSQSGDDEEEESEEDSDLEVIKDDEEESEEDDEEDTSESNDTETQKENTMTTENVEHVSVDMLSQITASGDVSHEGLDLSFSGNVAGQPLWTAFYKGVPVATASKADAGKNADIFEQPAFGHAVIAGAKHVGVETTLNEMGFKGIAHQIAISSVVADRVNAQVAEAKDALERDRKEYAERFMAALATAAIGINRGFFPDLKNPIKAALWNAVSSAGVKNAEVLIDNAFKASSDSYHTALFAKASEILKNPLEVQESLSKAVLGTSYMGASESSSNVGNTFEDRLENFGSVTASAQAPAQAQQKPEATQESTSSDARISSVVASLGRRR